MAAEDHIQPTASQAEIDAAYHAHFSEEPLTYCSGALAGLFLGDVEKKLPLPAVTEITEILRPMTTGSQTLAEAGAVLGKLVKIINQTGLGSIIAAHDDRVLDREYSDFLTTVNEDPLDKKSVVFVVHSPYFVILREAMALRKQGVRVFLLSLGAIPDGTKALFERNFDQIADVRGNYRLLRAMLARLNPEVFHVQCWMWFGILGRMAIENKGEALVVCEFYDVTSIYADREHLSPTWPPGVVEFEFAMERHILHEADAVITRFPDWVVEEWGARFDARPRSLRMQAFPSPEFISYGAGKLSANDGVTRLVYAGGLVPENDRHPPALFPETNMHKAFQALLAQGMAIDVLHDPNAEKGVEDPLYAQYARLAEAYPLFRFRKGVPPDALSDALNEYDYGILLMDYDESVVKISEHQRKGVMATKIFAYLEAGLPVLVNAEYEEMARYVTEHGIGLPIHSSDIGNAASMLAKFDYQKAVLSIKNFNEMHSMDREITRLIELYESITTSRGETA